MTSELTLAEVLVKPIRENNAGLRDQYERILRTSRVLTVLPITRDVLVAAATLRAGSSLKLPDAIHAATSIAANCTTHLTNDHRFASIPNLQVMLVPDLP